MISWWPLRSIFAEFLDQLLKDLVSWGSPDKCSMINHFLGDALRVLSCPFWSTVLQSGAWLPIHTLNCWTVQAVVPVFLLEVCLGVILLIIVLWQYCLCCIRSGVTKCTFLMVLYLDCMRQCGLHAVLWSHIGVLMSYHGAEPHRTALLLSPYQYISGTILLTVYSMVYYWQVSRAGSIIFYWPKLLNIYYSFYTLSLSHLSVYRLILWGLGLRTDRV